MSFKPKKLNVFGTIFLIIVGISFYFMMVYSPLYADDYYDSFLWGTNHRLRTFGDYLRNLYLHYFHVSGRFFPHLFIELLGVFLGKSVFNFLNSFVFILFLLLLTQYVSILAPNKGSTYIYTLSLATNLLFLLMPGFSYAFLWVCGACNYLWPSVLLLCFLVLLESQKINCSGLWLFLFGLICGWTNEAMVFGLAAGLFFRFLFFRQDLTPQRLFLLSGFFLGFFCLALSPASILRFTDGVNIEHNYLHQLFSSLLAMENLRLFPLLLVLLLVFVLTHRIPPSFLKDNGFLLLATGFSFFFILATSHFSAHSRFGIELYSFIIILRLLSPVLTKSPTSLCYICSICLFCVLAPTIYYSYRNHQEYNSCLNQIKQDGSFIIQTEEVQMPSYFHRLVLRFLPSEKSEYYHGFLGDDWIECYFGKDDLCFLPKRFLDLASSNNLSSDFDVHTEFPFYSKTVDSNIVVNKIQFHLAPTNPHSVPLLIRPFMKKFERWSANEVVAEKWRIITLPNGQTVLLVSKNPLVADRVSSISVL